MSDVGGFAEVARTGAGSLVPPGDPEALAERLGELLASPEEREKLAAAAAAAAAGPYSWELVAAQTMALYCGARRVTALAIVFWVSVALLVYTHLGYPALLWALARSRHDRPSAAADEPLPRVSLIVAAHDEEDVIERKVRDALALDYPRDRLEVIVASDGSTDRTVELARAAGADQVLDLERGGKVAALNAAVEKAGGEVLAFSDANSFWRDDALRRLVARLARSEGWLRVRPGAIRRRGRGERGGPVLALRDGRQGVGVPPRRGDCGQRGDQRGAARGLHLPRPDSGPGHLVPV